MTVPALSPWPASDRAYRRSEVSAPIGAGDEVWRRAAASLMHWGVKTASGFRVAGDAPVEPGQRVTITARVAGVCIVEPVEVIDVVDGPSRVGFSYATLPGHPVDGEEAFILTRDGDDVRLTVRSLTRASRQVRWRVLYPLLRVAQVVVRRRYLQALR